MEYDGLWFLGFNVNRPPFDELKVRQAVAHTIEKNSAVSFIPPGLIGYDATLPPYKTNAKYAQLLMKRAKYRPDDRRLKNLALLHTDGLKTIAIANELRQKLKSLGLKIELTAVSASDEDKWARELRSGKYQLFLMGYKANPEQLFTDEAKTSTDSAPLLEPLFKTGAAANFTGYSNPKADMLFDQLSVISSVQTREREIKLKEINKILYKDLPAVVLFYIEKL